MIGLPILENFGTRTGYLATYVIFTIFVIPQAVAQNFATLIVTRAIAGFFGGLLQNAIESFLADTCETDAERNNPVILFIFVYEAGVTLGPAWGSIFTNVSWRWIFYSELIVYAAFGVVLFFTIGETRGEVIRYRLEQSTRRPSVIVAGEPDKAIRPGFWALVYDAVIRPPRLFVTEPVVLFMALWSAFCFALVFMCQQSIESVFGTLYGFNEAQVGLVQISMFIGEFVGAIACLPQDRYYQRSAKRNTVNPGHPIPEARLMLSIPASFLGLAGGLFWYGWASQSYESWILPCVGLALVGFAIMIIVVAVVHYLTDAYTIYAGSAIAAVAMTENLLASWLPFSTKKMYDSLGYQWASSTLGFIALALSFAPVVLMWYGREIRAKSTFMAATN